jgi:hypothetical protein
MPTIRFERFLPALLALLALCAAACERTPSASSPKPDGRGLEIVDGEHADHPQEVDFGRLPIGEVAKRTVRLRNASTAPITIRDVQAGCTCTRTRLSYVDPSSGEHVRADTERKGQLLSVPAGVVAELELTVDTSLAIARNQSKLIIVRMTTDSPSTPFVTLNVYVFVTSPFRPAPAVIDLRNVAQHGGGVGEIGIAQDGLEGQRITQVLECPAGLEAELTPQRVGGVDLWIVRARIPPPVPLGFREHVLKLGTTGPGGEGEGPPLEVRVRATGVADAAIDPPLVVLQRIDPKQPPTASAKLVSRLPGQDLRVVAARAEGVEPGRIEVRFEPIQPDAQGRAPAWELALSALEDLGPAPLSGVLVVETDDEQIPRVQASWSYRP